MKDQMQRNSSKTKQRMLCIGAHPDDLEIGMGGTIARYVKEGKEVLMAVSMLPYAKNKRISEVEKAAKILGGAKSTVLDLNLDHKILTREIIGIFDDLITKFNPDAIYTHWNHDSHQDHRIVSDAVFSAARDNKCNLFMFEQILPGGIIPYTFRAQKFTDISNYINQKTAALKAHKSQYRKNRYNWVSGVKGRANQWGYMIGVHYAEAFEVVKIIEK